MYDGLRDWLPRAGPKPSLVFNELFAVWDDHVSRYARSSTIESYAAHILRCCAEDLTDDEILDVERYKIEFDTALLQHCRDHARQHAFRPLAPKVVAFVHPLYAQLQHGHYVSVKQGSSEALARLGSAFDGVLSGSDISRVLFEDVFFYAAATSLLAEQGIFDRVIFTMASHGSVLDRRSLQALRGRVVFMAGGYNRLCYTSAAHDVTEVVGKEKMWAVKDLTFQSPWLAKSLLDPKVMYRGFLGEAGNRLVPFPESRVIKLQEISDIVLV